MNIKIKNLFTILGGIALIDILILIILVYSMHLLKIDLNKINSEKNLINFVVEHKIKNITKETKVLRSYVFTKNKYFKEEYLKTAEKKESKHIEHIMSDIEVLYYKEMKEFISIIKEKNKEIVELMEINRSKSIQIIYSDDYDATEKKLDDLNETLLEKLNMRMSYQIIENELKQKSILMYLSILFIQMFISLFIIGVIVNKKILSPILYLTNKMMIFKTLSIDKDDTKMEFYSDEIGFMAEQFFLMKNKLDKDTDILKEKAYFDELTGIENRRSFYTKVTQILNISKRNNLDYCLILLDIDFFKKVNDTYGHDAGDDVLKHMAKLVEGTIRNSDIFARYGGEEFILFMPETDISGALNLSEKIRVTIEESVCKSKDLEIKITVSIGLSKFNKLESLKDLINRADKGLYKAKENGRNNIVYIED